MLKRKRPDSSALDEIRGRFTISSDVGARKFERDVDILRTQAVPPFLKTCRKFRPKRDKVVGT